MLLTHKKTLVDSSLPVITDYSDAARGVSCHGYITAIKDFGCFVAFYNNVKGLVPRSELGLVKYIRDRKLVVVCPNELVR